MINKSKKLNCRICGKLQDMPPWGEDGKCPTYDTCDCCGVEFGYQDCTREYVKKYRNSWLNSGGKWAWLKSKPTNWSLEEQMKNIPEEYK